MPIAKKRHSEPPAAAAQTSSPAIRSLVRLSLLERVSPELLLRFLRPFGAYLADRGIDLEACEPNLEWVGRLHAVLTAVDPAMPGRLQQALLDVADLARDQGHEAALQIAGQRQLGLFCAPVSEAPEDLASGAAGGVGRCARSRARGREARMLKSWFGGYHLAPRARRAPCQHARMRVVGKRHEGHGDRAGLDALVLRFGGGAPKGVFRYRTQEEANEDQERWLSERVQRRTRTCSESPDSSKEPEPSTP